MQNNYNMPDNNYNTNNHVGPTNYPNYNVQPTTAPLLVVTNQIQPNVAEVANLSVSLRSNPQFVSCPYCRNQGMTRVEQTVSCCNVLCCFFTAVGCWLIYQAVRGKDINCCDADHYCIRCGNKLGTYEAC